ncbi:MAG: ParA family protein [Clostridia bacterium]|nr:ParA family protein [Clostridia bacterium]
MKKVITALLNQTVNQKLKQYNEIEIKINDIQYQEGILEYLEINKDVNFIILSELLKGPKNIVQLIEEIKQKNNEIEIILILENKKEELENYLISKGKIKIFYNNEIEIKKIAQLIINKKEPKELEEEIKQLKEKIKNINKKYIQIKKYTKINSSKKYNKKEENNNKLISDITKEEINLIEKEFIKKYNEKENRLNLINLINKKKEKETLKQKVITVSGLTGIGKSIFTINLAKSLQEEKKEILIIDFDILNNSISTLLNVKNKEIKVSEDTQIYGYETKNINLKNIINPISNYIDLISGIDFIYQKENKIENTEIIKFINLLKISYDLIIIDTSIECFYDYTKMLMENSDKVIFLSEANILQIKKSKKLLNIYTQEWKINKDKINIIFNKIKEDSIDTNILKEILKNYNIIGEIPDIKYCNTLINQNMKNIFISKKALIQYKKISKEIFKNPKLKNYYLEKFKKNS